FFSSAAKLGAGCAAVTRLRFLLALSLLRCRRRYTEGSEVEQPIETFSREPGEAGGGRGGSADRAARNGRRPTMKEVAAVAGVSLSTVSRVVNGGPSVRADLAERVNRAV